MKVLKKLKLFSNWKHRVAAGQESTYADEKVDISHPAAAYHVPSEPKAIKGDTTSSVHGIIDMEQSLTEGKFSLSSCESRSDVITTLEMRLLAARLRCQILKTENERLRDLAYSSDSQLKIDLDEEAFSCPVCFEVFTQAPLLLTCGHSLCETCVNILKQNAILNDNLDSMVFECPFCRCEQDVTEDLVRNYLYEDILASMAVKNGLLQIQRDRFLTWEAMCSERVVRGMVEQVRHQNESLKADNERKEVQIGRLRSIIADNQDELNEYRRFLRSLREREHHRSRHLHHT